jgi:hypothetical protein
MPITGSVADSNTDYLFTPTFSVSTQNMSGGAFRAGSPLYSFVIPDQGCYDLNGNLFSVASSSGTLCQFRSPQRQPDYAGV